MTDKPTILIADDDRLVLSTLSRSLQQAGYHVLEASSGEEALALCQEHQPALAILDIRMPGLDGIETAARLRESTGTPFMIFTAYGNDEYVQRSVELGAMGYLVKPLDPAQIVPAVEAALERAAERQNLQQTTEQLQTALDGNRTTSIAVGLLMERCQLDRMTAFEKLRRYARSQRRKLADVAEELVRCNELLNAVTQKDH